MRSLTKTCLLLTFTAFAACNDGALVGDGYCPPGKICADLSALPDGAAAPADLGPGPMDLTPQTQVITYGSGAGSTPFDPGAGGSTRVSLDGSGNVILDAAGLSLPPQPIIWIANSGAGTESKIDTRTYKQLARYCTAPGCNADPSRTTVGLSGNVVVANRAAFFYSGVAHPERASAVGIAGSLKDCVDRNKNGMIDTFTGTGDIPTQFIWQASQAESPDECVLWYTPLTKDRNGNTIGGSGTLPRAAAYDALLDDVTGELKEYVYIGLYGTQEIVRLEGKTGKIVKYIYIANNYPYGAVMDKNGSLWVRNAGNSFGVARIDVRANDVVDTSYPASPCAYGITADSRGYIYTAGGSCVARLDPASKTWERAGAMSSGRGLALDSKFRLWVADTANGLYLFDASKPFGGGMTQTRLIPLPPGTGTQYYYLGIGLDLDEVPWIVEMGSSNLTTCSGAASNVFRVDPTTYAITGVATGVCSYTYSDMTGSQLRIAGAPTGVFRQIVPSNCGAAQTVWGELTWSIDTPTGTTASISVRSAKNVAALAGVPFTPVTTLPGGLTPPVKVKLPVDDSVAQIEVAMKSPSVALTPVIKSLGLSFSCQWGPLP